MSAYKRELELEYNSLSIKMRIWQRRYQSLYRACLIFHENAASKECLEQMRLIRIRKAELRLLINRLA